MHLTVALFALHFYTGSSQNLQPPPLPEPIEVVELRLPPIAPNDTTGSCSSDVNPRGTGCIRREMGDHEFQAGDFTPDGNHVIVNVAFVAAPAAPDPASIYTGEQVILVKADGTNFSNGDHWKCLSCSVLAENAKSLSPQRDYPHVFRSGDKALWGHNILDCGGHQLSSDDCTPNNTHIYPIHWNTAADGSGQSGEFRELRLHPDDYHLGWSSFTEKGGQNTYFGRLEFNADPQIGEPRVPRYDLVDVNLLSDPTRKDYLTANDTRLTYHDDAIGVGELRGFSGSGDEILYIGPTREANNIDVFAVHAITGAVRRLTSHPEYTDPIAFSHDDQWFVAMDTRGTDRQMWMSGMQHIPPLIDVVTVTVASSTRNNGMRRFFQPILIDRYGDRGNYFGQQVNAAGDGSNGAVNDPNWNGRADPAFSHDGTKIVYWQALVVSPACGGQNPLPCPISSSPGQPEFRLMVAKLTSRTPKSPAPVFKIPDQLPWATPFPPGTVPPELGYTILPGNYTLRGKSSGAAHVQFIGVKGIDSVEVNYSNFSDDGKHFIDGWEKVTRTILLPNVWNNRIDWYSDLVGSGAFNASKKTGPGGFHIEIDAILNIFNANGTLTTIVDGVEYHQPANGT
ncbi:hypothetical protein B0J11DRAFT_496426 [Dendryphion nanum]|uniref:Saponin hydrolase n=1 Tax=Dendryphion nanum TaxID=256645 RepID=A0A9P9D9N2_9PLEO|nr:hypothetical protein B0J11DRAFT_496426 [Dendryphion nanum]